MAVKAMDKSKLKRLGILFEKMVANEASVIERYELKVLYHEYIFDGRELSHVRKSATVMHMN